MLNPQRTTLRARANGMSIVELMVGITIGLFILAAAAMVAQGQLNDNRRLLLEAQVQQDVRIATELVVRDLRRAAYWAQASQAVWPDDLNAALQNNVYGNITPENSVGSTALTFARSLDEEGRAAVISENNTLDAPEQAGFRYNADAKTIEVLLGDGASYQTLTDPAVLQITTFSIAMTSVKRNVPCGAACPQLGPGGGCLRQTMRNATVTIVGQSTADPAVVRGMTTNLRLRNDLVREEEAPTAPAAPGGPSVCP